MRGCNNGDTVHPWSMFGEEETLGRPAAWADFDDAVRELQVFHG